MGKSYSFASLFIFTTLFAFGQSGPAGVGSSSSNVVWLDANSMLLPNGTAVSSFLDVSGNSNNFSQVNTAKQPIFISSAVNNLPAIKFDGSDDVLRSGSISSLQVNNFTYFVVFKRATMKTQSLISCKFSDYATEKWSSLSGSVNDKVYSRHFSPNATTQNHVSYTDGNVFTFVSAHQTATSLRQYNQGNLTLTNNAAYTMPGAHQYLSIGNLGYNHSQNHCLNGYIAEVIVFNTALNDLQRRLIENYLGAKYNMAIPSDYYAFQASHFLGLIGIGNDGVNSQSTAKGNGVLEVSSPSAMTSGEYWLSAHTNLNLQTFVTTDLPASLTGMSRWKRTWKLDETGDVGNTTLTFYLAGGNNFGTSSSYRLLVDTDGNFADATIYTGTYNSTNQTISFTVNLNDGDWFTLAGEINPLDIHSVTSGDWSSTSTWDCVCVPSENDNVFIEAGHNVSITANANAKDLTIETAGTLTMGANFTLNIYGNWEINGTFAATDGNIQMNGYIAQYINPFGGTINFHDFTINNLGAATVTLYEGNYSLSGTMFPNMGSLFLNNPLANTFTILSSSATEGGRVAPVSSGFTFTGLYKVQRNIPAGWADYRNLSSPLVNATLNQWDDSIYMSGTGYPDGCAIDGTDGSCFFSVKTHKNSIYYNVTNPNAILTQGTGYEVFVGDDMTNFGGTTLVSTGKIHDAGDITLLPNTGWHLVGNPFASPMLYSQTTRGSQVSNYFYVYDASIGDYQWYDGISGTASIPELNSGLMATGQGVWIYVTSLSTLKFHESCKTGSATFIKSQEAESSALRVRLINPESGYYSTVELQEYSEATDADDSLIDMRQLKTGKETAPGMSWLVNGTELRKNFISPERFNKTFDLSIEIKNSGIHYLEFSSLENFNSYLGIYLFDHMTGELIDLKQYPSYSFYSDLFEGVRFSVILTNELTETGAETAVSGINEDDDSFGLTQMGHTVLVTNHTAATSGVFKLYNLLGQSVVFQTNLNFISGQSTIVLPSELRGMYLVAIECGENIITKKIVL